MMKLRKLLVVAAVLFSFSPLLLKAAPQPVLTAGINVSSANVTETAVTVSTIQIHTASIGTQVLAANADRLSFDIQVTSCAPNAATTTKVYYSFSSGISSSTVANGTAYQWITQGAIGTKPEVHLVNPPYMDYTGPIFMVNDGTLNCIVVVRDVTSTSQLYR